MHDIHTMRARALRLLTRWAQAAEAYWHTLSDDATLGCYGPGYQQWGVQSNLNYAAAMATVSAQHEGIDVERWRSRALSAFRHAMATHVTGSRPGTDGKPWGNTWISMLGIERAMHGLRHLESAFTPVDHAALKRLLTSEADWLLQNPERGTHTGIRAGLWASGGCNNPENNIWSGALLWRVAQRHPDEPHAEAWKTQAHRFLMNGVSIEADASDTHRVAGRPVSDWHVGANFFPNYALDHHGYLNIGYMAICVSNAAILHFDLKQAEAPPPESLYHHQADLWRVLRRFVFNDGRLARIGGDSRVRYAYCQEYLLPSLLFAADVHDDPHALDLAARQIALMEREADGGNGLFHAGRLDVLRHTNPHYYTRLESDRACVLAMLLNDLPLVNAPTKPERDFEASVAGLWIEPAHAAVMCRSPERLAAFAWRAYGLSQAMCLPPGDSSLAEWERNLCPVVRCLGDDGVRPIHRRLLAHTLSALDGGFVTCGAVMEGVNVVIDEGAACTDQAVTHVAFAALPDGRTCLCLQYFVASADRAFYLSALQDMHLVIPNDVFNGSRRTLHHEGGPTILLSPPENDGILALNSRWVNIDGRLGVIALRGADQILVDRSRQRRAGRYQSLFTETLCLHCRNAVTRCRPGEVLVDVGFAVLSGADAGTTAQVAGGSLSFAESAVKGIWADGADGKRYALLANFSAQEKTLAVENANLALAPESAIVHAITRADCKW